jgi:phenylacetate-CoA ligase
MKLLQDLYRHSPLYLQNIYISMYGYYWNNRRFGGEFKDFLKGFKERESYSHEQWHEYQTIQLRNLLTHAFTSVPFYNELYKKHGFKEVQFKKFELSQLHKLPYLTKEDLRKFGQSGLISKSRNRALNYYSSSGSTGTPVKIAYSTKFHQMISAAMEARVRNWAGVTLSTPRGMIGGRKIVLNPSSNGPYYRYNSAERQTYFSAYHISPSTAGEYCKGIIKNEVEYMTGYAMSNYLLAKLFQEQGIKPPRMKAVITSSEQLTFKMRNVLEEVYQCKVYDSYSGVENCALISQHPSGDLLISPDVGIVERTEESFSSTDGSYEIACTGLLNYDQPLIRYKIGDRLTFDNSRESFSQLNFPKVSNISGRVEDVIYTEDGKQMVRFHAVFVDLPSVIEAQVLQHSYTSFTVKVVSGGDLSESLISIIRERMFNQLGKVDLLIKRVSSIPRTSSGKFKSVISEVK